MNKTLVVLSGGQDSTTCLYWAKQNFNEVHAITFDYGQKHSLEIESAQQIALIADIKTHVIINVPDILKSSSPLLDKTIKLETYENFKQMESVIEKRVELTFVPMRNAFFLTLAANHAIANDCYDLVIGVCQEDNANYPDCKNSFIASQTDTINEALGIKHFKIHAPLMNFTKAETVTFAKKLGAFPAIAFSHTCYAEEFPPCGKCHACILRAHGFAEAEEDDPLITRAKEIQ